MHRGLQQMLDSQLPSGALARFFWEGFPFELNQPNKDSFPMATGHRNRDVLYLFMISHSPTLSLKRCELGWNLPPSIILVEDRQRNLGGIG